MIDTIDAFDKKGISPMLIAETTQPFDSNDYIFELKLDGMRCIVYIDKNGVDLRNKRDMKLVLKFPELKDIYKCIRHKCILDGELAVIINGIPKFHVLQRRSILNDPFKIEISSSKFPATFVAFDIIYANGVMMTDKTLLERKQLLEECFAKEDNYIAYSRYIEKHGIKLFEMAKQQSLEGIVAKRKDSLYWVGKKTSDWVKIKVMADEDFVLCGYIVKPNGKTSFVIGQYKGEKLVYKGHITLGASIKKLNQYSYTIITQSPFGYTPEGNKEAVWLKPDLVCAVEYMPDDTIKMRQAVLKAIRNDKLAIDCKEK